MNPYHFDSGLLRFCLEHSDGTGLSAIPNRDRKDYEWLKEALGTIETNFQRMKRLIGIVNDENVTEDCKIIALEQLQEIIEDIDDANDFLKLEGISSMIKLLESSSVALQYWGSWIIATTVQNNPVGQQKAVQEGSLSPLLNLLRYETDNHLLAKVLSAISALLRDNKVVQNALHVGQVYDLLKNVLEREAFVGKTKMRAVLVLKHLCYSNDIYMATMGNTGLLPILSRFVSCEHDGLREQSLETLSILVREASGQHNSQLLNLFKDLHLKQKIQSCKLQIEKLNDEDLDARINELDLCNSVLEVL